MVGFIRMYRDTITLYNRVGGTWKGVVLSGVDLNADRGAIIQKYGANSTENAKLHIKYTDNGGGYYVGSYECVAPSAYTGASGTITLRAGNDFSFFVEGDTGLYSAADANYTDGFYDYMNANHDYCYAVTSVARYSVIPHYEVLAK